MAVVYKHIRLDTDEVFYIGIGKDISRITSKKNRNPHWHNIVNKHGYISEVIYEGITYEAAKNHEVQLIAKYGRRDCNKGPLVNMTRGGEGCPTHEYEYPPYYKTVQDLKAALPKWWHDGCGRPDPLVKL